ncbi:MAG: hypothetical protein K8M05_16065 [Deltaproteobacteria bacterium]|nr:hypothetical protein [Kofleriaceae bacterium]
MKHEVAVAGPWRPVAYIAVDDPTCRAGATAALERLGWTVIERPSGFHILSAITDVVEQQALGSRPGLIIVDEISRGCSGATLARGLCELGCSIPIVLVRDPWSPLAHAYGTTVHVVERAQAPTAIADLVRPWSPISFLQPNPSSRARATA